MVAMELETSTERMLMEVNEIDLAQQGPEEDEIRRRYQEDGYFIFRNVLDPELISRADQHVDWLLARNPDREPFDLGHDLARNDPFWYGLIADPRLLDIAEMFVGPDIAVYATHYICKEPFTGREVRWHQDGAFWPIEPMEVVTLWLAVTPSVLENGCLKVVPGSHHVDLLETVATSSDRAVLTEEIPVDVDEKDAVPFVLQPGDVSVHHPNIFHGSEPNSSANWRRGLTIRYIPTTTRILSPESASPFLLRGDAVAGVNSYLPKPEFKSGDHFPV